MKISGHFSLTQGINGRVIQQAGTGNILGSVALFGGGSNQDELGSVEFINFTNHAVTAGANLSANSAASAACGNTNLSVWNSKGNGTWASYATTDVYSYGTNTVASGTNSNGTNLLLSVQAGRSSVGNATVGVFAGGEYTAESNVYTYASNAVVGVFGGGVSSTDVTYATTDIYTYSNNTTATGTNLRNTEYGVAATGTATYGVFGGGFLGTANSYIQTIDIYNYSTNARTTGGSLSAAVSTAAAAGNTTLGIFASGETNGNGFASTTSLYTFATQASALGTSLTTPRRDLAGASATPGNF
jgi:hypothetical protein